MSVSLFKAFVQGMTDYIVKHNANYALIETNLNYLLGMVTGQAGGDISVPPGLKEVFDRKGLIGIGSYGFNAGTLTGPSYNLAVASRGLLVRGHRQFSLQRQRHPASRCLARPPERTMCTLMPPAILRLAIRCR